MIVPSNTRIPRCSMQPIRISVSKAAKPLPYDLKGSGQVRAALADPGVDGGGGEPVAAADFLGVEA